MRIQAAQRAARDVRARRARAPRIGGARAAASSAQRSPSSSRRPAAPRPPPPPRTPAPPSRAPSRSAAAAPSPAARRRRRRARAPAQFFRARRRRARRSARSPRSRGRRSARPPTPLQLLLLPLRRSVCCCRHRGRSRRRVRRRSTVYFSFSERIVERSGCRQVFEAGLHRARDAQQERAERARVFTFTPRRSSHRHRATHVDPLRPLARRRRAPRQAFHAGAMHVVPAARGAHKGAGKTHWRVCQSTLPAANTARRDAAPTEGCLAVSIGIGGNWGFEDSRARLRPYMGVMALAPRARAHKAAAALLFPRARAPNASSTSSSRLAAGGLTGNYGQQDAARNKPLDALLALATAGMFPTVDVDCEGCEWRALLDVAEHAEAPRVRLADSDRAAPDAAVHGRRPPRPHGERHPAPPARRARLPPLPGAALQPRLPVGAQREARRPSKAAWTARRAASCAPPSDPALAPLDAERRAWLRTFEAAAPAAPSPFPLRLQRTRRTLLDRGRRGSYWVSDTMAAALGVRMSTCSSTRGSRSGSTR